MATRQRRPDPTEEELEILKSGSEYFLLSEQPGWKRLLAEFERDTDLLLGRLRESKSTDDKVQAALAAEWRRQELFFPKEMNITYLKRHTTWDNRRLLYSNPEKEDQH